MGETESYDDFDGFITPDGEMVPIQDTDRMFSIVARRMENPARQATEIGLIGPTPSIRH